MDLPADLQTFISTHIGWEYNQLRDEARRCNNITKSEYMGTYFPRSFVESYEIFELLAKNEFISEALSQKVEIHVLDIGSGTGGNFLGYLWFLQDKGYLQRRADLAIYLRSYDKDRESLEIQNKITRRFFNDFVAADYKEQNFESSTAALSFLRSDLRLQGQKYDVIMCSKFVNEFYNCRDDYQNNKGFYQRLIEISGEYLSEDGFLIISDITTPCFEGCDKWLPELMSSEINRALREPGCELSIIQPLSCAFFQAKCAEPQKCFIQSTFKVRHRCLPPAYSLDWSKICIKVLCKKTFAHRILSREEVQQSFIIARKQDNKINTCSDWGDRALCCSNNTSAVSRNFRDAFGWSNSQT